MPPYGWAMAPRTDGGGEQASARLLEAAVEAAQGQQDEQEEGEERVVHSRGPAPLPARAAPAVLPRPRLTVDSAKGWGIC